jgi:hypothetical protein
MANLQMQLGHLPMANLQLQPGQPPMANLQPQPGQPPIAPPVVNLQPLPGQPLIAPRRHMTFASYYGDVTLDPCRGTYRRIMELNIG